MDPVSTLATRRFTVDEYQRMAETGVLHPDERVELIEGAIVEMSPIGTGHCARVDRLNARLVPIVADRAIVRVQGSVILSEHTQPEPDLALLAYRDDFYVETHPRPPDILLLIEVADSSLRFDQRVKAPLYARHGISEMWLVDLIHGRVEVHRDPRPGGYASELVAGRADALTVAALPEVSVDVGWLLS